MFPTALKTSDLAEVGAELPEAKNTGGFRRAKDGHSVVEVTFPCSSSFLCCFLLLLLRQDSDAESEEDEDTDQPDAFRGMLCYVFEQNIQ